MASLLLNPYSCSSALLPLLRPETLTLCAKKTPKFCMRAVSTEARMQTYLIHISPFSLLTWQGLHLIHTVTASLVLKMGVTSIFVGNGINLGALRQDKMANVGKVAMDLSVSFLKADRISPKCLKLLVVHANLLCRRNNGPSKAPRVLDFSDKLTHLLVTAGVDKAVHLIDVNTNERCHHLLSMYPSSNSVFKIWSVFFYILVS
ncbi:hypothetical protein HHK36_000469 [Tetracentron sinense]|uniref:Uncharacterized protein n=1 Tax=Tetracentron sinense TaxID=13715 RepID=A0A835DTV1_TETSI|nr:hypothetical protein HHK36_000469 [Tetracentron sinense]